METVEVVEIGIPVMTVVSAYGFGIEPERKSFGLLKRFIGMVGWDEEAVERKRIFGFNNPDPAAGSPRYGYENWITVDPSFRLQEGSPEGLSIKTAPGGLYAGLCSRGIPNPEKWGGVVRWINGSRQWLEEIVLDRIGLDFVFGREVDINELSFVLLSPIIPAGEKL